VTFDQIVHEVLERMSLTSADAQLRVGAAVNRHYRRITSLLGMETTRIVVVHDVMTVGLATVSFQGIEKIDRIFDVSDPTTRRMVPEVSLHRQRMTPPGTSAPGAWAMQEAGPDYVVVLFDTVPQLAYALQADGWVTRAELVAGDEPLFPASFHDVLTWFALSEELLRKEKTQLATAYEGKAEALLNDLRFHLADTHTRELRQGSHPPGTTSMGGGTGSGPHGGSSYTQTGDVTFDRPGTGVPPFFVAADNNGIVTNLNSDMVDNEHAAQLHDLALATGTLPLDHLPAVPSKTLLGRDAAGVGPVAPLPVGGGLEINAQLQIADLGVATAKLADLSVTTPKLAALAVTTAKIADANVTTPKIADANVTFAKLENLAAGKLLGRGSAAGAGAPQPIDVGAGLLLTGTVLSVTVAAKPFMAWTALSNRPPAAAFATPDYRNGHAVLDFDGVTDEEAVFEGVLSPGYGGSGLTIDLWVALTTAVAGNFRFQVAFERMDVSSLDIDADSFAAFNSAGGVAPATSGQFLKLSIPFTSGAQMDGLLAGEAFRLKVRRDADGTSGTDDITTDAELLRVALREV
jgi:hypothetical protein